MDYLPRQIRVETKIDIVRPAHGSKQAGLCLPARSHVEADLSLSARHVESSKLGFVPPYKVTQKQTCPRPLGTRKQASMTLSAWTKL